MTENQESITLSTGATVNKQDALTAFTALEKIATGKIPSLAATRDPYIGRSVLCTAYDFLSDRLFRPNEITNPIAVDMLRQSGLFKAGSKKWVLTQQDAAPAAREIVLACVRPDSSVPGGMRWVVPQDFAPTMN